MEKYLRENMEKLKKELEEEVREFVERLQDQLKRIDEKLSQRITQNKETAKKNKLEIENQVYFDGLLTANKLRILNDNHKSKQI